MTSFDGRRLKVSRELLLLMLFFLYTLLFLLLLQEGVSKNLLCLAHIAELAFQSKKILLQLFSRAGNLRVELLEHRRETTERLSMVCDDQGGRDEHAHTSPVALCAASYVAAATGFDHKVLKVLEETRFFIGDFIGFFLL